MAKEHPQDEPNRGSPDDPESSLPRDDRDEDSDDPWDTLPSDAETTSDESDSDSQNLTVGEQTVRDSELEDPELVDPELDDPELDDPELTIDDANATLDDANGTVHPVSASLEDDNATVDDVNGTLEDSEATRQDVGATVPDIESTTQDVDATIQDVEADDQDVAATLQDVGATIQDDVSVVESDKTLIGETLNEIDSPSFSNADKTVDGNATEQTLVDLPHDAESSPKGRKKKTQITVRAGQSDRTVRDNGDSDASFEVGSIMASREIGMTVNPRDLPAEDLDAWNTEVGEVPAPLPPAIERELSDEQSERLRECRVAGIESENPENAEYRLMGKLGRGGMGDVYVAKQDSLDRLLAVKVIKPLSGRKRAQLIRQGKLESVEEERRKQFLSEAIVTSDLDHPNIVPIHDVALTSRGDLFYSMKRVKGTPWSDVIAKKSQDENIEILLKACDAVAFAHTRGVIHRDIKPENIMLGDFGVVLVMDWGLALPTSEYEKTDSIYMSSGLGGTPAFMAPELALGPLKSIGPAADIYLFGATLYMIITGKAPHQAKSVMECLRAVKSNHIQPVPEHQQGELMDIAFKAMETDPADRYPDLPSFQQAIRDYRSRAESISLATRASDDLKSGRSKKSYADLSRAAFRFEEAIRLWSGNERAIAGLATTKQVHASAALENGDFDLGLSLLDESNPEQRPLVEKIHKAKRERESRQSRLKTLRTVALAMLVFIVLGTSVAAMVIYNAKRTAEKARDSAVVAQQNERAAKIKAEALAESEAKAKQEALAARDKARDEKTRADGERDRAEAASARAKMEQQRAETEKQRAEMEKQRAEMEELNAKNSAAEARKSAEEEKVARMEAERQERIATAARDEAELQRSRAEYEQYVSMIGLAKARLDRNEAEGAREILNSIRTTPELQEQINRWEWRWLWQQANQARSEQSTSTPSVDAATDASGLNTFVVLSDGTLQRLSIVENDQLGSPEPFGEEALGAELVSCVAVAPDNRVVAVGTRSGDVLFLDQTGSVIDRRSLHEGAVTDAQFTADGRLVTGSRDRTTRVWQAKRTGEWVASDPAYHLSPVQQIAVAGRGSQLRVAVAVADQVAGRVAVWDVVASDSSPSEEGDNVWKRRGTMTDHRDVVTTVAITADGKTIASGDMGGNVWMWPASDVKTIDHEARIQTAIEIVSGDKLPSEQVTDDPLEIAELVDPYAGNPYRGRSSRTGVTAHTDVIRSLRFSNDGSQLLTASDDYTVKLWGVSQQSLTQTFKGHGGWVVWADFLPGSDDAILSASNDSSIRTWSPKTYVSAAVIHQVVEESAPRQTQAHREEILAATFSSDGTHVITASHDHTARVMEIDPNNLSFKRSTRLEDELLSEGSSFVAMSLGLHQSSQRLFIGSADATIRVWDLALGTQIHEARGTGLNSSFAVSDDGLWMLTGSSRPDAKALLWALDPAKKSSPKVVHALERHEQAVTAFAISPDAKWLFTADRDGRGILWSRETGEPRSNEDWIQLGSRANAAVFSADGKTLYVGNDSNQLTIIDVDETTQRESIRHAGLITQVVASKDGKFLLTVSEGEVGDQRFSQATLWDADTRKQFVLDRVSQPIVRAGSDSVPDQRVSSARFDEDTSKLIVVARSSDRGGPSTVRYFDLDAIDVDAEDNNTNLPVAKKTFELPPVLGSTQAVIPIDANRLVTMNRNGGFKWDVLSRRLVKSYRPHASLTEASFSLDASVVVTASRSLKVWDAAKGQALAKKELDRPIESVQFAPAPIDGSSNVFATGDSDGTVSLWRWNANEREIELVRELTGPGSNMKRVRRVRFFPNADRLLVVGDGGRVEIWNLNDDAPPRQLPTTEVDYRCGSISADGSVVAAGATDKKIRVWLLDGEENTPPVELSGHADEITDVKLIGTLAGGIRVMSSSTDDTARVWDPQLQEAESDTERGREILSLRQHTGDVTSVDATKDGQLLMTAGRDGKVILWPAAMAPENLFD